MRKQCCIARKCWRTAIDISSMTPDEETGAACLTKMSDASSFLQEEGGADADCPSEWESFWGACMILQRGSESKTSPAIMTQQQTNKLGLQAPKAATPSTHARFVKAKANAELKISKQAPSTQKPSSIMLAPGIAPRPSRCGECSGCLRIDCGVCEACKDKPRFGGKGLLKRVCVHRTGCGAFPAVPGLLSLAVQTSAESSATSEATSDGKDGSETDEAEAEQHQAKAARLSPSTEASPCSSLSRSLSPFSAASVGCAEPTGALPPRATAPRYADVPHKLQGTVSNAALPGPVLHPQPSMNQMQQGALLQPINTGAMAAASPSPMVWLPASAPMVHSSKPAAKRKRKKGETKPSYKWRPTIALGSFGMMPSGMLSSMGHA